MNVFTAMGVVFITLKILGLISWSWWLVTLPLWGGLAFMALAVIGAAALGFAGRR